MTVDRPRRSLPSRVAAAARAGAALALFLLVGCAATETRNAPEENVAIFDAAWSTIAERHYDPNLGGVDWNGVRDRVRPKAEAARTDAELRVALAELTDSLGHSHVSVFAPGEDEPETAAVAEERAAEAIADAAGGDKASKDAPPSKKSSEAKPSRTGFAGFHAVAAQDDVVVSRVTPDSPADKAGLRVGDVLLSVDGRSTADLIKRLKKHDPEKWRGSAPYAIANATSGGVGNRKSLEVRGADGAKRTTSFRLAVPPTDPIDFGLLGSFASEFETRRLEGGALYVRFTPCYPTVVDLLSNAIDGAPDATGLVLDLRGNPGGFGATASGVARLLLDVEAELGVMKLRKDEMRFIAYPAPNAFRGPVVILVDEATGSTSEILAAGLKDLGRVRVVGRSTMGAALPSVVEKLPGGWRLLTVIADFKTASGTRVEGPGVAPDVVVTLDAAAFAGGRDPDVEAALAALPTAPTIETWNKPTPAAAVVAEAAEKRAVVVDDEAAAWMTRWVDALGGEAALRQKVSMKTTSRVETMGLKLRSIATSDGNGRLRVETEMGALGRSIQVVNDDGVFEASTLQGVRELAGGEAALTRRLAIPGGEAAWRETFAKVEFMGRKSRDGKEFAVLRRTPHPNEGEPETIYLDLETALPVHTEGKIKTPQAEMETSSVVESWRKFDGALLPEKSITTLSNGVKLTTTIESVAFGVPIEDALFEKPEVPKRAVRPKKPKAEEAPASRP